MTFRTRLLLASLSTLAVGLAALLILGNVLLGNQVDRQTRDLLRERSSAQLAALRVQDDRIVLGEAANDDVLDRQAWIFEGGRVLERPAEASPRVDAAAVALGRSARSVTQRAGPHDLELRAEPVRASDGGPIIGSIVVAISTASLERLEQLVLIGSLVIAALVLLAGTLAIRSALGGALRPVARMTQQAEAWGAHDLESRFALGPPRDELTALAATLDHLLARIAASRRHEQRFAADVAHELRTPLAGIRGRAELALGRPADEAERRRALEVIVEQAQCLTTTVDTLLAVARGEIGTTQGTVDLGALAREIDGVEVRGRTDSLRAEGDPEVVRRALDPLLDNARRHAAGSVWLELSATESAVSIAVRDNGPGVSADLAGRVFEPGVSGAERPGSAGLGLALARRLAQSCGGDVTVVEGPGGTFVLTLPAA